jgi:methylmalonyl-CoA/ethylmalonyl-CoA epimerase
MSEFLSILQLSELDQVGVVVEDVEEAARQFHKLLGVGPARIVDWPIEGIDPQATLRGKTGRWRMRLGFIETGAVSIELIEPVEGQSLFSEFLETHGPGLHHVRFLVDDFDADTAKLEAAGITLLASGRGAHVGSWWAFFDTAAELNGLIVELRQRLAPDAAWLIDDQARAVAEQ